MPTVPQPYVYPIANIPGGAGGFTGQMSDHLYSLILSQLPGFTNPIVASDEVNVTITGDVDLEDAEKLVLDSLVDRAADYFVVTLDGSTDLGEPAEVEQDAGLTSAVTFKLQYKDGLGNNSNGFSEEVRITAPRMPIDKVRGNFDGLGRFEFTVGASLDRGSVEISVVADGLPQRTILVTWK